MSGDGGGQPTSQTVTQTTIPEYLRSDVEEMVGMASGLMKGELDRGYQEYGGQRIAGFSPMQAQAFQNISGQQVAPQLTDASNMSLGAGQASLGYGQRAGEYGQRANDFGNAASNVGLKGLGFGEGAAQAGQAGFSQANAVANQAGNQAHLFGTRGHSYGQQGQKLARNAQIVAERGADQYGGMGSGYGAQAAGLAGGALGYGATGANLGQQGMAYGAQGAGIGGIGVQQAQQGFNAGRNYRAEATSPGAMGQYMSPYMENVVDRQQQEAIRESDIMAQKQRAAAVGQGAFGGSRSAIVEAERQRNLGDRLGDIEAAGLQKAFQDARQAQQFGSNLGIQGLQAGYQGLDRGMAGTSQGMQGAQIGMEGQRLGLSGIGQAGQMYGLGMQGANVGLQGNQQRIAAGQLGLQGTDQAMKGASLGLQGVGQSVNAGQLGLAGANTAISGQRAGMEGVNTSIAGHRAGMQGMQTAIAGQQAGIQGAQAANQAAGTLGQLGQAQFDQQMGITDAMQKYGALQQAQQQAALDTGYDDYLARQNFPYQQIGFFSDVLRGLPMSQSSQTMYGGRPDTTTQLIGGLTTAAGASMAREGGHVKRLAQGGVTAAGAESMNPNELAQKLKRLSDGQLQAYARTVKDPATQSVIRKELQRRQGVRTPQLGAQTQAFAGKARGGIVALSGGGDLAFGPKMTFPRRADLEIEEPKPLSSEQQALFNRIPIDPNLPGSFTGPGSVDNPELAMQRPSLLNKSQSETGAKAPQADQKPTVPDADAEPQIPAKQPTGIMAAGRTSFEQFRDQIPRGEMDPARQAILDDMQARLDERLAKAEGMEGREIKDAIMAAGLAMMSGQSLSEGVALAAQAGGQAYFESREDTEAAMLEAENAELAFRQYELDLLEGNESKAREEFGMFLDHTANMANARARMAAAQSSANLGVSDIQDAIEDAQGFLESSDSVYRQAQASRDALQKQLDAFSRATNSPQAMKIAIELQNAESAMQNRAMAYLNKTNPMAAAYLQATVQGSSETPPLEEGFIIQE